MPLDQLQRVLADHRAWLDSDGQGGGKAAGTGGPSARFMFPKMLMPQAWSLGLEGFFYLLFPVLMLTSTRLPLPCTC